MIKSCLSLTLQNQVSRKITDTIDSNNCGPVFWPGTHRSQQKRNMKDTGEDEREDTMQTSPRKILIVDDEHVIQMLLSDHLGDAGFVTLTASTAEDGLAILACTPVDIAVVDIRLGGMSGIEMLGEIKRICPETEVVIMTSHASAETAIEAIRKGAYDYLMKPFDDLDIVSLTLRRAIEKRELTQKNKQLLSDLGKQNDELSRTVGRLSSLINAGRAMGTMTNLRELLDYFVELVSRELNAGRVSIMLMDRKTKELRIAASRGISHEIVRNARVKLGQGISGHVAITGQPLLVNDVWSHPTTRNSPDPTLADSFVSCPIILSVPIKLHDTVLGVINVTNKHTAGAFSHEDVEFLCGLTGQAAVAIENAWRFTEMETAYESLKESQAQLVASERLNALGEMAAGVAHDLNNVLGGVLGKTQILLQALEKGDYDGETLKADLGTIEQCALQGAETVRRIQSFTRIRQDLPKDVVDLNEVVKEAVEMTRHKWKSEQEARGIVITVQTDLGKVSPVQGMSRELVQALSNLIFNAVEAMPRGGTLELKTFQQDESVILEVTDSGTGMNEDVQRRIFDPFFTTKETGNGLGLSVTYGIIARHNGDLSVQSTVGGGTTFRVAFPARQRDREPQARSDGDHNLKSGFTGPLKVLVVEDDRVMQVVIGEALLLMGHQVAVAGSAEEALSLFSPCTFDLVVTDLCMQSMSGLDLARRIREIDPRTRIVLCSGWALQQGSEEMKDAGINVVVQKPVMLADLDQAIRQAWLSSRDCESSYYFCGQGRLSEDDLT